MILISEDETEFVTFMNKINRVLGRYVLPYSLLLLFIAWSFATWIAPYWLYTFPIVGTFVSLFLYIRKKYSSGIKKSIYGSVLLIFVPGLTYLYLLLIIRPNWSIALWMFIIIFSSYLFITSRHLIFKNSEKNDKNQSPFQFFSRIFGKQNTQTQHYGEFLDEESIDNQVFSDETSEKYGRKKLRKTKVIDLES